MSRCAVFLAEGFEEVEALTPVDLLRRAGITCEMVSISDDLVVKGSHGIGVLADRLFADVDFSVLDMIILPGGQPGTNNLSLFKPLMDQVDYFASSGKPLAAICAAPTILGQRGLLGSKNAVCYPGLEDKLTGASTSDSSVVTDGQFTTSRGVGCAIDFSLDIIRRFCGDDEAARIAKAIVYAPYLD